MTAPARAMPPDALRGSGVEHAARVEMARRRVLACGWRHRVFLPDCDDGARSTGAPRRAPAAGRRVCPAELPVERVTAPVRGAGRPVPSTSHAPSAPVDVLAGVVASLDSLTDVAWHDLHGQAAHDALDLVEQVERRLAGVRSRVVATVEANGLWAVGGARTFTAWLRNRTDTTAGAASRQVRHARALRDHLPRTRQALEAGRIGQEHVGVLVREALATNALRVQLLDAELGEAFLVEQAGRMDATTFTRLVKAWAIAADPAGADRAWRESGAKEELTLARTLGGYHLAGWLDEVSGQAVEIALRTHMGRKGKDDERTAAQRRAAALVALARQSLDAGMQQAHARVRPHLTVTTSWETLQALVRASGSVVPPTCPEGRPAGPGAAVGVTAQMTLEAPGGPRDSRSTDPQSDGVPHPTGFVLSERAQAWMDAWRPGDDHVIPAELDHELLRGVEPASLEGGTPLPPAVLAWLACGSGLSRVVFGAESTVLNVGREKRLFTAHQVKAIIARDRHCQVPGCDEPPGFGEVHHALHWYQHHGPTDVDLGLLVCWFHHAWVHAHGVTVVRHGGRWFFYDRHGRLITDRKRE